jgi:hypothetical protein
VKSVPDEKAISAARHCSAPAIPNAKKSSFPIPLIKPPFNEKADKFTPEFLSTQCLK